MGKRILWWSKPITLMVRCMVLSHRMVDRKGEHVIFDHHFSFFGIYVQYTHDHHIFHFYLRETILPKGGYGSELTGPAGFRWFSTENETVYGSFDAFFLTYTHLWVPDISIDIPTWRPFCSFFGCERRYPDFVIPREETLNDCMCKSRAIRKVIQKVSKHRTFISNTCPQESKGWWLMTEISL